MFQKTDSFTLGDYVVVGQIPRRYIFQAADRDGNSVVLKTNVKSHDSVDSIDIHEDVQKLIDELQLHQNTEKLKEAGELI